ncbi:MAG TPA: flagellar hook-basal body complex protein FliE [Clostridia bacterium]|nr:flagellar hook-basal body complex protein FliE [Clostridia bacterium]
MAAQQDTQDLIQSGSASLHQLMINMEKADIALRYTIQVRNKLLEAYQEIMRMQL